MNFPTCASYTLDYPVMYAPMYCFPSGIDACTAPLEVHGTTYFLQNSQYGGVQGSFTHMGTTYFPQPLETISTSAPYTSYVKGGTTFFIQPQPSHQIQSRSSTPALTDASRSEASSMNSSPHFETASLPITMTKGVDMEYLQRASFHRGMF